MKILPAKSVVITPFTPARLGKVKIGIGNRILNFALSIPLRESFLENLSHRPITLICCSRLKLLNHELMKALLAKDFFKNSLQAVLLAQGILKSNSALPSAVKISNPTFKPAAYPSRKQSHVLACSQLLIARSPCFFVQDALSPHKCENRRQSCILWAQEIFSAGWAGLNYIVFTTSLPFAVKGSGKIGN